MHGPLSGAGSDMPALQNIAVIGLGVMGAPMASHLARSGFNVTGIDMDPAASSRFPGAILPQDAVLAAADVIVTMLPEGRHVLEAYRQTALQGAREGAVFIRDLIIEAASRTFASHANPVADHAANASDMGLSARSA